MALHPNTEKQQEIARAVVRKLSRSPREKITIATIAKEVGVTESALYRHFPSKMKMMTHLLVFAKDSILRIINTVSHNESDPVIKLRHIFNLLLVFAKKNPGISRLLVEGNADDVTELGTLINQLFNQLETQIKIIVRMTPSSSYANKHTTSFSKLFVQIYQGKLFQFVNSGFQTQPDEQWEVSWNILASSLQMTTE